MSLQALSQFDRSTSNNILAATALSTAAAGSGSDSKFVRTYQNEIAAVLDEIRKHLRLPEGKLSEDGQARVNAFLSDQIDQTIFPTNEDAQAALARAAHAGLVSPALYHVVLPKAFVDTFRDLGGKERNIRDAIHSPDDLQHLMTEDVIESNRDVISLFMKRVRPETRDAHWLLVQTIRKGMEQIAQAAWRVYPADVDFDDAQEPIDVLKAFAEKFGVDVVVGTQKSKFVVAESFAQGKDEPPPSVVVARPPPGSRYFTTFSHRITTIPDLLRVGIVYCINLTAYKEALISHGFNV